MSSTATKPRLSITMMLLNLLGCTSSISPVEEMGYMTTSKRLTLNNPVSVNLEAPPELTRTNSIDSKLSKRASSKKSRSVIIESPSGFKHEFHVDTKSDLYDLEKLRIEVERRVQEAATRHAELNSLARKHDTKRRVARPVSLAPVKRKPVPSIYPDSPLPSSPGGWSSATLTHSNSNPAPSPLPSSVRYFEYPEADDIPETPSSSSSDNLADGNSPSPDSSSVENMHPDDVLYPSSDEGDSSSVKSSTILATPLTSSPEVKVVELGASEAQPFTPPPTDPITKSVVETIAPSRPHSLLAQPSIAVIDVNIFGVNTFAENVLTFEAGQAAREARGDIHKYVRRMPQSEEDRESCWNSFVALADNITNY